MEEVPRRTSLVPLALPCFELCLIGVETEGLLDCQGRAGIISIVRWNLRPVVFGVEIVGKLKERAKSPTSLTRFQLIEEDRPFCSGPICSSLTKDPDRPY